MTGQEQGKPSGEFSYPQQINGKKLAEQLFESTLHSATQMVRIAFLDRPPTRPEGHQFSIDRRKFTRDIYRLETSFPMVDGDLDASHNAWIDTVFNEVGNRGYFPPITTVFEDQELLVRRENVDYAKLARSRISGLHRRITSYY